MAGKGGAVLKYVPKLAKSQVPPYFLGGGVGEGTEVMRWCFSVRHLVAVWVNSLSVFSCQLWFCPSQIVSFVEVNQVIWPPT